MITREEFIKAVTDLVQEYIDNFDRFDIDPQLRVNPELLYVDLFDGRERNEDLGDSDEAIEDAAYAQGDATMSATDYQASQNPDFYPVKKILKPTGPHTSEPDAKAIAKIADNYFKK